MTDFFDGVFDGYRLKRQVMTLDGEVVFLGERIRDGEDVWVWTAEGSAALDPVALRARHERRARAVRKTGTTSGVLGVRELIHVGDAPGMVTDVPRGRGLDEILADSVQPRPIREVLRWFGRVLAIFEAAHMDGIVHAGLTGRYIYVDKSNRPTVFGLVDTDEDDPDARRADVRALSALLYHATTGRPPRAGFPYTGQAANPREIIDGYPDGLARFLVQRLSAPPEDPVVDAGIMAKALEALSVDPDFRRAAGLEAAANDPAPHIIIERDPRQWRLILTTVAAGVAGGLLVGGITFAVMQVKVDAAERRAVVPHGGDVTSTEPAAPVAPATAMRADVWRCIHSQFGLGSDGQLSPEEATACASLSAHLTSAELVAEVEAVKAGLTGAPAASDAAASEARSYQRLFGLGPDEVAQYMRYRLDNRLPTEPFDRWIKDNLEGPVLGVLQTLAARGDRVAPWARNRLEVTP